MKEKKVYEKKVYIEIIRVIAIFLVLYAHTGIYAMSHYEIAGNRVSGFLAFAMMCIAQTCNSLFFMITGAVLLQKEEKLSHVVVHRFLRMLVVVVAFSLFQYAENYMRTPEMGLSLPVFFKIVYSSNVITQYWFLYSYLGLLLILPILRALAKALKRVDYMYLFTLYFVIKGVLPIVEYFWENKPLALPVPVLENIIFFPLIGYFMEHESGEMFLRAKNLIIVNLLGVIAFMINMIEAWTSYNREGLAQTYYGMTLVIAVCIFADVRYLCTRFTIPQSLQRIFFFLGSGVFGVYLLDLQLREKWFFLYTALEPKVRWFPATVVWLAAAMLTGIIIMNILKRIPVIRKFF